MNRNKPATIEAARRLLAESKTPCLNIKAHRAWQKEAKQLCNISKTDRVFDSYIIRLLEIIAR